MEELLTISEAARFKGVDRRTIYAAVKRGVLCTHKRYGQLLVSRADLDAYTPIKVHAERGRKKTPVISL